MATNDRFINTYEAMALGVLRRHELDEPEPMSASKPFRIVDPETGETTLLTEDTLEYWRQVCYQALAVRTRYSKPGDVSYTKKVLKQIHEQSPCW